MAKENILGITVKKDDDYSEWYTQVIQKSGMIEYSSVSGCMVIRPYAYEIWEMLVKFLDEEFKKTGVKNAYFPLFIPEKLLMKEQEHVEGFSPEVAWVTHTGDTKLNERLAVRPTSETIMYESYKKWIRSYNDLPLKINQWNNVVRWEFKHPVPFLRTREFLWQEGHTAFATQKEADDEVRNILGIYAKAYEDLLAVPMLQGKKSEKEKFAGADYTLSVEGFLYNGKAIQGATSHALGQNFSKAFDINFINEKGNKDYVWQNSWGYSTRSIGVMVMLHGDDKGLVLPPRVAPIQAVVIPITFSDKPEESKKIIKVCQDLKKNISARVEIDDRDYTPGWKYNHWELKGVPLRIEIGPKDVEKDQVTIIRRDTGKKEMVKRLEASKRVSDLLKQMQKDLLNKASTFLKDSTVEVKDMKELENAIKDRKLALASWCKDSECEDWIKDKTGGAKSINAPFENKTSGKCVHCGKDAKELIYFAKSY